MCRAPLGNREHPSPVINTPSAAPNLFCYFLLPPSVNTCREGGNFARTVRSQTGFAFPRYMGKGCLKAVGYINDVIAPKLMGMDPTDQAGIDKMMVRGGEGGREPRASMGPHIAQTVLSGTISAVRLSES